MFRLNEMKENINLFIYRGFRSYDLVPMWGHILMVNVKSDVKRLKQLPRFPQIFDFSTTKTQIFKAAKSPLAIIGVLCR